MLQMRKAVSARSGLVSRGLPAVLAAFRDRCSVADPGLMRLLLASRGTLSVVLTTLACIGAARALGASAVAFASGIVFSSLAPFLAQEPTWRQRLVSMLWLALPAMLVAAVTSVLHGRGLAGEALFLGLLFACFLFQARNRRIMGLGFVAVITAYIGLYLRLPPETIPAQVLSVVIAIPATAFACFVVFPLRPARTLRHTIETVRLCAARVLRDASAGPRAGHRLERSLARLNTVALAADDQLAATDHGGRTAIRIELINLELATAQLIAADAGRAQDVAERHARQLRLHASRLGRGGWRGAGGERAGPFSPALAEIRRAAAALAEAAGTIETAHQVAARAAPAAAGPFGWRIATRVTLACALAMAGGIALSENRWFWSVITTYVVFLGARSRGDTIYKGLQRVFGTILGIVGGLVLAFVMRGDPAAEIAIVLLSVFGMYYCIVASYTFGIFCVTILLGLLYSMLGSPLEELLVLRLEETAIGAAAAILVAVLVLPTRTRDAVRRAGLGAIAALAAVLVQTRKARDGEAADPLSALRALDRQLADLRLAMLPITVGRSLWPRTRLDRPVSALLECVRWARVVAMSEPQPGDARLREQERLQRLAERLAALAEPAPSRAAAMALPAAPAAADAAPLDNLERAVDLLGERIAIGTLAGFALER